MVLYSLVTDADMMLVERIVREFTTTDALGQAEQLLNRANGAVDPEMALALK